RVGCELFYETTPDIKDLGKADAALAGINRLLDDNQKKGTREYNFNVSILELAAYALEMFFCGETTEALEILTSCKRLINAQRKIQLALASLISRDDPKRQSLLLVIYEALSIKPGAFGVSFDFKQLLE